MDSLRPTILIVDDEYDICIALQDFLTANGYDVQLAHTGQEGISKVRAQRFEAVILDLGLPDQDGMAVLQVLNQLDPHLPIIVLTAFAKSEKAVDSLNRGSFAYLMKPYNRDELKAILARAVGVRALTTEVKRTETALTESEGRFRAVVQSAAEAIICADRQGCVLFWNRAAERLFGYREQEVLGQPLLIIMPARFREAHQERLKRYEQTGEAAIIDRTIEVEGLHKDGKEFPIELSIGTWDTKEGQCYSAIVRDITDRKRWEAQLRQQQIEQQVLLDLIPAMVWYKDRHNRIIRTNRLAAESIHKTIAEVEGQLTRDLYPDEAEKYYEDDLDVIQSGHAKLGIFELYQTPSGGKRWVQTDKVPYRDPAGNIIGVLVFAQDITERRKAEEVLQREKNRAGGIQEAISGESGTETSQL
ncbi:MAG: PAS domain S-box protein [Nitrospirota bacterium]|nr:PAS domain S-box protein [Nitrospirota bacterium]